MKQIAVWKVVALTLITGGVYAIVWAARNHTYALQHHKDSSYKAPHWLWLASVLLVIFLMELAIMVIMLVALFGTALSPETTTVIIFAIAGAAIVYTITIGVWWQWHFGKVLETITQGRLPRSLSIVLYIFTLFFVVAFQQYYINRIDSNKKGEVYTPSLGLILLTVLMGVLSFGPDVWIATTIQSSITEAITSVRTAQEDSQRVDELYSQHEACINQLNSEYPNEYLEPEEEAPFNMAYAKCQALYEQYLEAYNTAYPEI